MNELLAAGAMALLAVASVGLWTLRVALTARGRRPIAATVAALEAVVFAVAFTNVAAHLDSPVRIAGYAGGVAFGTMLGLSADRRLSAGVSEVDIVVPGRDPRTTEHLRRLGWPATTLAADGPSGPVTLIRIAVDDVRLAELTAVVRQVAPDAFWTVQHLAQDRDRPIRGPSRAGSPSGQVGAVARKRSISSTTSSSASQAGAR